MDLFDYKPELAKRFGEQYGRRTGRLARALMPFASSLGRDGAPEPPVDPGAAIPNPDPVVEDAPRGYRRP